MAEVDREAEDEGLKQSIMRYAIEVGAIEERVYRKEMEIPIEDMKRFLDGILHIYDEGRTKVSMGDLFGIGTGLITVITPNGESDGSRKQACRKRKFRGTLTKKYAD